jgi:hypothetical protein
LGTDDTAPYEVSWNTDTVADGEHVLSATAFDAAGNTADSAPVAVTVSNTPPPADTVAPTVGISTPAAGSTVSGTVQVSGTASDDVGVTEVRFFADGVPIGTDATAPYEISWDTTAGTDGSRELTADAVDAAGNTGNSQPVTVTVDNSAPAPALASLTLDPGSVTGGNSSTGTVTLDAAAPEGGIVVTLESSNATAAVPASITVPQGATGATFTVSTSAVSTETSATITATHNGVIRTATLTVTPPATDTVTITRAEYDSDDNELRVEGNSSDASATLAVYVTSTGELIGTFSSGGRGEFDWPTNPVNITVRSNLGGSATSDVRLK